MLNGNIPFEPRIIKHTTGINVVIVVYKLLVIVSDTLSFTIFFNDSLVSLPLYLPWFSLILSKTTIVLLIE